MSRSGLDGSSIDYSRARMTCVLLVDKSFLQLIHLDCCLVLNGYRRAGTPSSGRGCRDRTFSTSQSHMLATRQYTLTARLLSRLHMFAL